MDSSSRYISDGLVALHRRIENLPMVAHNRYWSYDTVYKQRYAFVLDVANGKSLPLGNDSFWIDLFTQARNWGLVTYEQNWLSNQTISVLYEFTTSYFTSFRSPASDTCTSFN